MAIKLPFIFPSRLMSAFALPGENRTNELLHFYSIPYHYLIKITHENIFVHISGTFSDSLFNSTFTVKNI